MLNVELVGQLAPRSVADAAALIAIGAASALYLLKGIAWDKPDPYDYIWFEKPTGKHAGGSAGSAETRNIAQKLEEAGKDLVVFWGSQSGTSEILATRLAKECHQRFGLKAISADLSSYDACTIASIPQSKLAIFIISTYGEGDPSDNTIGLWEWLHSAQKPNLQLSNLRYMAFGLGNSTYKHYNRVIKVVSKVLDAAGAEQLMPVGLADDAGGNTEEDFLAWKEELFRIFREKLHLEQQAFQYEPGIDVVEDESLTLSNLNLGEPPLHQNESKQSPSKAIGITSAYELCSPSSGRNCIHMEFDIRDHPELRYRTGDHVAVYPVNPDHEVQLVIAALGYDTDRAEKPLLIQRVEADGDKVKVPSPTTLLALLRYYLEICSPVSRETIHALAGFAPTRQANELLVSLSQDKTAYAAFVCRNHVTIGRILKLAAPGIAWDRLPLSFLVEMIPPARPRYYSISSSSVVSPRRISITCAIDRTTLSTDPVVEVCGLTSNYLFSIANTIKQPTELVSSKHPTLRYCHSGPNGALQRHKVYASIRQSKFRLPVLSSTPLIMVGTGSGIAPFRAFIMERARLKSIGKEIGKMILFFGCRHPEEDWLYRQQLEDAAISCEGLLEIIPVYSQHSSQPRMEAWSRPALPSIAPLIRDSEADNPVDDYDELGHDFTNLHRHSDRTKASFSLPFQDRQEVLYLAHYVEKLSPVIDICDPNHSFGTEVPKRAFQSPLLASSILAFASRDWFLLNGSDHDPSEAYCAQALQILIPVLDGPIESLDENILAGIVLLRLYEEMSDVDTGTHLLGSTRLLNSASSFASRGGLGEAASWIVLRQYLYLSITRSQPLLINLDCYSNSTCFQNTNEEASANRIILLCAQLLMAVFGSNGYIDNETWLQFDQETLLWYESVSWCCKPDTQIGHAEGTKTELPDVWMATPVHVIAFQHYYLSKLFLAVYKPQLWLPGDEALLARPKTERCLQQNMMMIVSLAISNPKVVTASFTAHHVLYTCLRKFPNMSTFSGMSALPFMILAHGGARSTHLAKLHKDNPVLRTGPNSLAFGRVSAIKDIYGHGTPCIKDESYVLTAGSHYHLADVIDKADHSRKRRVLSSAYALKNLENWEHKVADKVRRMITQIDKQCTDPMTEKFPQPQDATVDLRMWFNFFSLDAIADIGLSEKLGLLDRGHDRVDAQNKDGSIFEANLRESLYPTARKQSLLLWSYEHYKLLDKLSNIIPFYRRMSESSKGWDAIVLRRANLRLERYRAGEKLDDFFQALMEDKNGKLQDLEWGEIVAEVNIMMNAGSVTTAIAITNVIYQLLRNPETLEKVRREVDDALEPDEIIAPYDKVKHLPYLRACLDESLRLFPPTPQGLGRKTPPEGLCIMGHYVPGNTSVSISALVAHRDETAFPEAEKFIPERFLGEKGKELQSAFLAFSAGARGCIGRNISYLEQAVLVASVIHRYDFALPRDFELQRLETMNHILGPMPVKAWRRRQDGDEPIVKSIMASPAPSPDRKSLTKSPSEDEAIAKRKDNNAVEHVEHAKDVAPVFDDSIEDTKPSRAVWLITFTVATGGFLFGYETGVISAVLVTLNEDLGHKITSSESELITSMTSGGALVGSIIAGLLADRFGRKLGMYIGCSLFLVGSIIWAASFSVAQMAVARFVVGLGVGSAAMIIPLYIGELAPASHRGRMIAFDNLSVTLGQLLSYAFGAAFTDVNKGWRIMVAIGSFPPIVLACLLPWCPESPRQLLSHGKREEALKIIARVYPEASEAQVKAKVDYITWTIENQAHVMADKTLWWQFKQLFCKRFNLRALTSACAIMAISQLGGFNTLMYYSGTLFSLVGFDKPTAVSIVVGGTNFLFTGLNMLIIDKAGRRIILLVTVLGMSLAMAVAAIAFNWIPISKDLQLQEGASANWASIVLLVTIIVYVAFFASGVATIGWVGTELLPLEVRALGTMMNTATCWSCNIIIASTFLSMMKGMTPSGAFGFYSGICFLGWIFVIFCYPEVKGLPLEEVRQIFEEGFGVKRAAQIQKQRKLSGRLSQA
ncbi:NADPH--cytochrome P450 reductase [Paramyrothecium foliicola]|nr:NADPH--cytochrome P450 reductase [Paramyrothecium foliicola]